MSESTIRSDFERISKVLAILYDNPEYAPKVLRREYNHDFNRTNDSALTRVLKIERAWDWRERVYNSFRCALPQSCNQMSHFAGYSQFQKDFCQRLDPKVTHGWIPLERHHCFAWWNYYWRGRYTKPVDRATGIIVRNFDRWRVWGEEED